MTVDQQSFFYATVAALVLPRKYHREHRISAHGEPVAQRYAVYLNLLCYSNEMSPISVPRKSSFLLHSVNWFSRTLPLAHHPARISSRVGRASRSSDCLIVWQPMHYFHANRLRHCSRYIHTTLPCENERHSILPP